MNKIVVRMNGGIDKDFILKEINKCGGKVVEHDKRTFLVEYDDNVVVSKLKDTGLFSLVSTEITMHKCVTVNTCGITDNDIDNMSVETAKEKLKEIRNTAIWWAGQEDDDRCYLDDIKVLQAILPHGSVNFTMPEDLVFIENCIKFKKSRCPKNLKIHEW